VPGLIAVALSTEGSVENVMGIAEGTLESGLSQADISYWAYNGKGIFAETGPIEKLRAVANLFPEAVHVVVRRDAGVHSLADLRGKRVSLDREGSGTRVDALLILEAFGLGLDDIEAEALAAGDAADRLRAGELDAFIMVVGTPANAVTGLAEDSEITLVPIAGPEADALRKKYPFFAQDRIEAGTYFNVPAIETLSVGAQWLVSADLPEELVYGLTRALWHGTTRRLLDNGHPKGRAIQKVSALDGLAVPLHPGAQRYYEEAPGATTTPE
jgi:TRAP transporter TAXI family solute receptor